MVVPLMFASGWTRLSSRVVVGLSAACLAVVAPVVLVAEETVDYLRDVKPLLQEKCFSCHGALKQEGGLRLDTASLLREGGDSGEAVLLDDPAASLLIERVTETDEFLRMPLEGTPLTPEQVELMKAWIASGAEGPADEQPEADPSDHWAYRVPERPPVPEPAGARAWGRNPIDAFVAVEHERRGLAPSPPAERDVLLRRVSLNLTGLPPTREELRAFREDDSPHAYERAVERLLESPQYGERWGRHWMDVWRYSDWYGRRMVPDVWNSAPQIWRWRDWIVRSLNDDKGYDRMVAEMLAADEIAPEDPEAAVATGYLVRNWYALNPNDWMRANVEHTAKAFLAMTFNCAHCHDHKYDPISHDDYFRLRAFFEPIGIRQDRAPGEPDPGPFQEYQYSVLRKVQRLGTVQIFDKNPEAPTWFYTGGDERNRLTERGSIPPGVPETLGGPEINLQPVELPPEGYYPGLRPDIQETVLSERTQALGEAEAALESVRSAADEALPPVRERLAAAEAAFAQFAAEQGREDSEHPGALAGQQSLLLDATSGRRTIHNPLESLGAFSDGAVIRFELLILNDAHVNFQLAQDVTQGLTAGWVGFEQGRIVSYQPGSFTEFEAGRYDFEAGQNRFGVVLSVDRAADRCLLTVVCRRDGSAVVDGVPVALNGWNPVGDPVQAILLDARAGSAAVFDEIVVSSPNAAGAGEQTLSFDFEPPRYADGQDALGVEGWSAALLNAPPAFSVVSMTAAAPELRDAAADLRAAQRDVRTWELKRAAAEAAVAARRAEHASVLARIAADRIRYGEEAGDGEEARRAARRSELEAAVTAAEATRLARQEQLAAAEAKPSDDEKRGAEIDAAAKQLTEAKTALEQARATLADEEALAADYAPLSQVYPKESTGRRRALAEWIASPENPLTARVAVNHVWMRHFHAPLVSTVFDFGRSGAQPTHPELLDWLAVEFMESGWSLKHLHRLIVTSETYRMTSRFEEPSPEGEGGVPAAESDPDAPGRSAYERDPENRYLWRMNTGRMEAEIVRDSLLFTSGGLDLKAGGQELENSEALTTNRRSLYYSSHPEADGRSSFGALFDAPDPNDCYRRTRSLIPQQALALTNSDLVHASSGALAEALWAALAAEDQADPAAFVRVAFEQVLGRAPTEAERGACAEFLAQAQESDPAETHARLRESLVRVLYNHTDFVTIR